MGKYSIYRRYFAKVLQALTVLWVMASCSSSKFIPEGEYLLDKVGIECRDKQEKKRVNASGLSGYIRQNPNARWFSLVKVPLGIYSLSGRDTSKWVNRTLQRIGEPPVIYDRALTERSTNDIRQAMQNMGYLGAEVEVREVYKKRKVRLTYELKPGERYRIRSLKSDIKDSIIARYLEHSPTPSLLSEGMVLDINRLNEERIRIAEYLQNQGYYKFTKDYITFTADTVKGEKQAEVTMHLNLYSRKNEADTLHPQYKIGTVNVLTEFDIANIGEQRRSALDSLTYGDIHLYYKEKLLLRPRIFEENLYLQPGRLYRARNVERTYSSLARLHALKYTNIHFVEREDPKEGNLLDSYVLTARSKTHSFTAELEGTNTAGDLGAAASLTFQHRNLFKGSETFTIKLRGAYEAISGLQGYTNEDYTEYGIEASLNFPRFMFPFLSSAFKRRIRASSEVGVRYNTQERPEFSRRVASASWSYKWTQRQKTQHRIDLIDINYVYMPSISGTFKREYLDNIASNSILKYNYEDLFIARMGYSYSYNSSGLGGGTGNHKRTNFSIRTNIESAGNLLNLISHTLYDRQLGNGQYALGNIAYAQYLKGDFDFTQNIVIDYRNSISFHFGLGIAYPYGNSTILPFEKRYFSGGANSVRGWSVRSLGPGSFSGGGKSIDFINQSGDVKLDISLEYRTFMFWKLNGAVFIDAGNIWTLRSYEEQPGGEFRFHSFFKEIAVAYGIGLRLNFDYFILRFDGGMKAINPEYPTSSAEHYPLLHPDFDRDFTFHFAVGYPF